MSFLLDNKKIELNNTNIISNITCVVEEMNFSQLSKTELIIEADLKEEKEKEDKEKEDKEKEEKDNKLQVLSSSSNDDQQININYSNLSINLTKNIDSGEKKKYGIYFTPPKTIIKNLKILEPYMANVKNVLEPSCGS